MSFFSAIGKMINDSGIPRLFVLSGLLTEGSLNSFISGKHFNRCKKLHPVAALSFKSLHFKNFLNSYNNGTDQTLHLSE